MEGCLEYEEWYDENADELWCKYHESMACYDTDYEDFVETEYEEYVKEVAND